MTLGALIAIAGTVELLALLAALAGMVRRRDRRPLRAEGEGRDTAGASAGLGEAA